ncbi:MAG TPA: hypothetical protein VK968_02665, partial [Roseimicrobium sp.]|nr:hypothetical protein [Roseimicrobium sp.]
KIDSDKALKIVLKEPLLEDAKPTAVKFKLDRFQGVPVWKIDLWAASVKNPAKEKSLGDIWVDTKEGKIVQSRLKINKAE